MLKNNSNRVGVKKGEVIRVKEVKGSNKKVGRIGEAAAAVYVRSKGHELLGRNIRLKRGEIDILTKKDRTLHVVEVKTALMANKPAIAPEESFSKLKIGRLKHLANVIKAKYPECTSIQVDGVAIRIYSDKKVTARYYPSLA